MEYSKVFTRIVIRDDYTPEFRFKQTWKMSDTLFLLEGNVVISMKNREIFGKRQKTEELPR